MSNKDNPLFITEQEKTFINNAYLLAAEQQIDLYKQTGIERDITKEIEVEIPINDFPQYAGGIIFFIGKLVQANVVFEWVPKTDTVILYLNPALAELKEVNPKDL